MYRYNWIQVSNDVVKERNKNYKGAILLAEVGIWQKAAKPHFVVSISLQLLYW